MAKIDLTGILPPGDPSTPEGKWQRKITVAVILLSGSVVGIGGAFAAATYQSNNVTNTILSRMDLAEASTIAIHLLMMRTRYCAALKEGRMADVAEWQRQIGDDLARYQGLTKNALPPFESCS